MDLIATAPAASLTSVRWLAWSLGVHLIEWASSNVDHVGLLSRIRDSMSQRHTRVVVERVENTIVVITCGRVVKIAV